MLNTSVSMFWNRVADRARSDGTDYGVSDLANRVAAALREANRDWKGDAVTVGPGLINRLLGCGYQAGRHALEELIDAGYVELVALASPETGPTRIRWIGPGPA